VRTLPARYTVDSTRKQNEVCERADGKQSFITKKGKSSMKTQANTQTQPTQNDKPAKLALSKETIRLLTSVQADGREPATRTRLC
jgi:hypothetical protein